MPPIADTGFVYTVASTQDRQHQTCAALYRAERQILVPQSVVTETLLLMISRRGNRPAARFLTLLYTTHYEIVPLEAEDFIRTGEILEQYADTRIDFVDASVIAVAERLNETRILTLDRRDFSIVRPNHADHLDLLP